MMFLALLLFVTIITILVTWSLNRGQADESTKDTKQATFVGGGYLR